MSVDAQRYGPFKYSPIIDRPPLVWPNGARLAVWIVPNLEFFPLNEMIEDEKPRIPNVFAWSRRDYGNRVGVFRLMELLSRRKIRATAALDSEVCLEHPRLVERACDLGWEFMAHGESNNRPLTDYDAEEERLVIRRALTVIEAATGRRPHGWLGSGGAETWHSLENLAVEGIRYIADWINDDQPYLMNIGEPPLVSTPYSGEINDAATIRRRLASSREFARMIRRQFEVLYAESETSGRVMCISLHPWIIGVPHRIGDLAEALDFIMGKPDVWFATGEEIVQAYLRQLG